MRGACQVADLTLMIRATRGRSRRPNHMPSRMDALQTMGSVDFRRLLGSLHSVAKQASFDIASGSDFRGLRSDFKRFWEAKMEPKINVSVFFSNLQPITTNRVSANRATVALAHPHPFVLFVKHHAVVFVLTGLLPTLASH